jgi:hypothetical protein
MLIPLRSSSITTITTVVPIALTNSSLLGVCVGSHQIFQYDHPTALSPDPVFAGRVEWRGTLDPDIQIGAIFISNLTANDSGTYRCRFQRTLFLSLYNHEDIIEKRVELQVVAEGGFSCSAEGRHSVQFRHPCLLPPFIFSQTTNIPVLI